VSNVKVTDFIASYLSEHYGVDTVFMVTGGGAMHLNDSFGRHPRMKVIFNHHEQACAIAAEGYVRSSGKICVVNITTGPGGLNTLTGVLGQWTDSVPVLYISGQVRFDTTIASCPDLGLRQLGDQEVDITRVVSPIVKYASIVRDPTNIRREIDRAIAAAVNGRPGPAWIDVPMNVQGARVDPDTLKGFDGKAPKSVPINEAKLNEILGGAERPVIIAGHGIRLAKAIESLRYLLDEVAIPVVTTFNGYDLIESAHPNFVGRVGTIGDRAGNFAVQNSDLLLCIGTRNNIRQVGYNYQSFARAAVKVVVDIDPAELEKTTLLPDMKVATDAGDFLKVLIASCSRMPRDRWSEWLHWCRQRKERYPVVLQEYRDSSDLNPYLFIEELTKRLKAEDLIVAGNGTACVALFQAGIVKKGQRSFWNSGCAAMGYDLPAAIGAAVANPGRMVVCLAGDGSLQLNLQELATLVGNNLEVKLFVLNNGGYISIKQTQMNFFGKPLIGCDKSSGLFFPRLSSLAQAYDLRYFSITRDNIADLDEVLRAPGPCICEVMLPPDYRFSPKSSSEKKPDGRIVSKPLEDLAPFLEREEFMSNMIIAPLDE